MASARKTSRSSSMHDDASNFRLDGGNLGVVSVQ